MPSWLGLSFAEVPAGYLRLHYMYWIMSILVSGTLIDEITCHKLPVAANMLKDCPLWIHFVPNLVVTSNTCPWCVAGGCDKWLIVGLSSDSAGCVEWKVFLKLSCDIMKLRDILVSTVERFYYIIMLGNGKVALELHNCTFIFILFFFLSHRFVALKLT